MKIKTITCHDVYNCGASLQAFALMKYLENLGHDVEIINYKPDYLSGHFKILAITNEKYKRNFLLKCIYLIVKLPNRLRNLKQKKLFDDFRNNYLKLTDKTYSNINDLKRAIPKADIYIAGSDQIWNSVFPNGKDPSFYLEFVPNDKIKASYAASFATEKISDELKEIISIRLKKLNFISVREISGLNILKGCGIKNGFQVLDPVFLLDKTYWRQMCSNIPTGKNKYLFVYDFDNNNQIQETAEEIAYKYKLKIYSAFKSNYADKQIKNLGPLEFISYIENAKFVISNSFHATAFSIIFEKPFLVINRKEGINTRMRDLIRILGIEDRMIDSHTLISELTKINYNEVNLLLDKQVENSKKYLTKVILEGDCNGE